LVFSLSSINMRICKSRAAHPRVNEPAVVLLIIVHRQTETRPHRIEGLIRSWCMAWLIEFAFVLLTAPDVKCHPCALATNNSRVVPMKLARDAYPPLPHTEHTEGEGWVSDSPANRNPLAGKCSGAQAISTPMCERRA
jgi:hypothetical protein